MNDVIISAIVLAYNRSREVLITVEKLKAKQATLPFRMEIIVVDNASVDDTSKQIAELHPDIMLISKPTNNGIAGWNEGFKIAKGKYFLVLDDDSNPENGLSEAIAYLDQNPAVGILALYIDDLVAKQFNLLDPEEEWQDQQELPGFIGCGAIIRKEVYQKIGGFSEWIYVYTHEFDYGIRCLDAGYRIEFFSNATVTHRTSKLNRSNKRLRIYATRNELTIIHKYFTKDRWRYLLRVFFNNLKFIRTEGLKSGYYICLGGIEFLKLRRRLEPTPVSIHSQKFYADNFWSTQHVLGKVKKKLGRRISKARFFRKVELN